MVVMTKPARHTAAALARPKTALARWMVANEKSVYRLSEDTGIAWQTAAAYIAGRLPKNPRLDVARKLSGWTDGAVSVSEIMGLAAAA